MPARSPVPPHAGADLEYFEALHKSVIESGVIPSCNWGGVPGAPWGRSYRAFVSEIAP